MDGRLAAVLAALKAEKTSAKATADITGTTTTQLHHVLLGVRLIRDNALSGRSIRAGRLLVLHSSSSGIPGSGGRLLLRGREPVEETVAEHCEIES